MQDRSTGIGVLKSVLKRPSGVNSNRLGIKFVLPNSAAATVQEECDETSETQSIREPAKKRPASAKAMEANRILACKMEEDKLKEQEALNLLAQGAACPIRHCLHKALLVYGINCLLYKAAQLNKYFRFHVLN